MAQSNNTASDMASESVDQELVSIFNDAAHVFAPLATPHHPDTVTANRLRRPTCPLNRMLEGGNGDEHFANVFAGVHLG